MKVAVSNIQKDVEIASKVDLPLPTFTCYQFKLMVIDELYLPEFSGSAFRGLFGQSLKKTACVTGHKNCKGCLLQASCVYASIFETPPKEDQTSRKGYNAWPHPFVFVIDPEQPRRIGKDEIITIGLNLIGEANKHLAYIIHAFQMAGKRGLGHQQVPFELKTVSQLDQQQHWKNIYSGEENQLSVLPKYLPAIPSMPKGEMEIQFLTPLRIKHLGKFVGEKEFTAQLFFRALQQRITDILQFHTPTPVQLYPAGSQFSDLLKHTMHWKELTRYSSRQHCSMKMGGLTGSFFLSTSGLENIWPWIWIGQYLHVGKLTSMGLGSYQIVLPQACHTRHRDNEQE